MRIGLGISLLAQMLSGAAALSLNLDRMTPAQLEAKGVIATRTGLATMYDETGRLTFCPNNLLSNSEDLTAATWLVSGSTTGVNSIVEDSNTDRHIVYDNATISGRGNYILVGEVKDVDRRYIVFGVDCQTDAGAGSSYRVLFDLQTGTAVDVTTGDGHVPLAYGIEALTDDWYKVWVKIHHGTNLGMYPQIGLSNRAVLVGDASFNMPSYLGTGKSMLLSRLEMQKVTYELEPRDYNATSGAAYYGPRFDHEPSTAGYNYITRSSTPWKLIGDWSHVGGSYWTSGLVLGVNAGLNQDGILRATSVPFNAQYSALGAVAVPIPGVGAERTMTFSVWLKRLSGNANLHMTVEVEGEAAIFNAITLTDEWVRYSCPVIVVAAATIVSVYVQDRNASGWGTILFDSPQLNLGTTPDDYVDTSSTVIADYPISAGATPLGIQIEGSEPNELTYSTPNPDDDGWSLLGLNADVDTNFAIGPDGTVSASKLYEDATMGFHAVASNSVVKAAGVQTWTGDIYVKSAERHFFELDIMNSDVSGGVTLIINTDTGIITTSVATYGTFAHVASATIPIADGWFRVGLTVTTDADTGVRMYCGISNSGGVAAEYSGNTANGILVYGAMLRQGTKMFSSLMPTAGGAATRGADNPSMTDLSWYNEEQGTFEVEYSLSTVATDASQEVLVVGIDNDDAIIMRANNSGGQLSGYIQASGVNQGYLDLDAGLPPIAYAVRKQALAYKVNDVAQVVDGGTAATDTSVTLPVGLTGLYIGNRFGGSHLYGHIKSLKYYNVRKSNDWLVTNTRERLPAPAFAVDFSELTTEAELTALGIDFARTDLGMVVDETGRLTYGPNNVLRQSSVFDNFLWAVTAGSTLTPNAGTDRFGNNTAYRLVGTGGSTWYHAQNLTLTGLRYIVSGYVKSNTGANQTFRLTGNGLYSSDQTATDEWQRFFFAFTGPVGTSAEGLVFDTAGNGVDLLIDDFLVEAVTYQTTPRAYNETGAAAYYGPRFTHDPASVGANYIPWSEGDMDSAGGWLDSFTEAPISIEGFDHSIYVPGDGLAHSPWRVAAAPYAGAVMNFSCYVQMDDDGAPVHDVDGNFIVMGAAAEDFTIELTSIPNVYRLSGHFTVPDTDGRVNGFRKQLGNSSRGYRTTGYQVSLGEDVKAYSPTTATVPAFGATKSFSQATPLGLMVEKAGVNLLLRSQELDHAAWSTAAVTVTANQAVAPDGTTTADQLDWAVNGGALDAALITVTASTAYTISFWAKRGNSGSVARMQALNGSAGFANIDVALAGGATSTAPNYWGLINASTWTRVTAAITTPVGCTSLLVKPLGQQFGDAAGQMFVWGVQLEPGHATSHIPTAGVAGSRAVDEVSVEGEDFSSWYNQDEGTLVIEGTSVIDNSGTLLAAITDLAGGTVDQNYVVRFDLESSRFFVNTAVGGSQQGRIKIEGGSIAGTQKIAAAYKRNSFGAARDGVLGVTDITGVSGALPTSMDRLYIGSAPNYRVAQYIYRTLTYYDVRLRDATLKRLTA